jgi:hypothetical protein
VLAFDIASKPEVGYLDRGVRSRVLEEKVLRLQVPVHCHVFSKGFSQGFSVLQAKVLRLQVPVHCQNKGGL